MRTPRAFMARLMCVRVPEMRVSTRLRDYVSPVDVLTIRDSGGIPIPDGNSACEILVIFFCYRNKILFICLNYRLLY